ncbi:MAG: ribbon-helix-helix protein, CopG family [Pseudonocardia sp.]
MKTAISLPDAMFARVEDAATRLGVSRSEIFARAAERYLDELDADSITDRINAALDAAGGTDQSNVDAAEHARTTFSVLGADW